MARQNWIVLFILSLLTLTCMTVQAQDDGEYPSADSIQAQRLDEVSVSARRKGTVRIGGPENGVIIGREELFRAACCNLGESFTTNPSVDVNYSDATTGAKQIKLLGLSGIYVQMLTENLPNFRGAASPYALDYVPGPWMQSIQVSKGTSSVRNGYESITGQIDIEYLKPDTDEGVTVNLYGNTLSRLEANADANIHLNQRLSTELLLHYQDDLTEHDVNDDGFMDQPNVRQWNLQNRWKWRGDRYLFHGGLGLIKEKRNGGQSIEHSSDAQPIMANGQWSMVNGQPLYQTAIETNRYEGYMKHAFILNPEHGTNIALMGNVALHQMDATFGHKRYDVDEKNAYLQLLFETDFTKQHDLSTGLSYNYDHLTDEGTENTIGTYAQYTYNLNDVLVAMAGLRADHSNQHGTFVTPRLHLKLTPHEVVSFRLSAGKGYRTPHALAENTYLLASGREMVIEDLKQEEAWNYGASTSLYIPIAHKTLRVNLEYARTDFSQQAVIDYDSNPTQIRITNLDGKSYSNTFQVDASYPLFEGLELSAAWRWNDVKTTYGGRLMEKPLNSRYKGLFTASYKTPLGLWQFDMTLQLNGGGRMPNYIEHSPLNIEDSSDAQPIMVNGQSFPAYEQLSAQITRWFRHFSVYIGGENLTGFRQQQPIINAADPWSSTFDPTMIWGPVHGALGYIGIRMNFGNKL